MSSSTPGSRTASPSRSGGGGRGPGSSNGAVSLTPLSPTAPSTSTALTGAVFGALPSCLMPEAFTGEGHFEDDLQQFTTAASLSGWQTASTDNRPYYFALRLKRNALHFYTTLAVAKQPNFHQLIAAFRTTYTTNVEVPEAKLLGSNQTKQSPRLFVMYEHLLGEFIGDNPSSENKWSLLVSSKVFTMLNTDGNFERTYQPVQMLL